MANMTITLEDSTKEGFLAFCREIGLSASSVLNLCVKTIVRENRIPFAVTAGRRPNAETLEAMREGERLAGDPGAKRYDSLEELWEDLEK